MSEFGQFDIDLTALDSSQHPSWPEFEGRRGVVAKQMYARIVERRDAIKKALEDGIDLKGKERQVIAANIAKDVGKNANYLTKREFPTIHRFIAETNDILARLTPVGAKSKPQVKASMTRKELIKRVDELETQLDKLGLEPLIENAMLEQLGVVRQQNIKLRAENDDLNEKLVKARKDQGSMTQQISDLLTEIHRLKRQVRKLGGNPEPTSSLMGLN